MISGVTLFDSETWLRLRRKFFFGSDSNSDPENNFFSAPISTPTPKNFFPRFRLRIRKISSSRPVMGSVRVFEKLNRIEPKPIKIFNQLNRTEWKIFLIAIGKNSYGSPWRIRCMTVFAWHKFIKHFSIFIIKSLPTIQALPLLEASSKIVDVKVVLEAPVLLETF